MAGAMQIFDQDNPWILEDNRRLRHVSRTTPQSMNHKHQAMLPAGSMQGKTVLDLGCCIGGTGYWALRHGAAHYTGVEVQPEYVRIARALFTQAGLSDHAVIHQADLAPWLEGMTRGAPGGVPQQQWDVVVLAGVLFGYIDPLHVLRMSCELARECVVIDTMYPRSQRAPQSAYIEVIPTQRMTMATSNEAAALGAGSRITPVAQDVIMANYGFQGVRMAVAPITDSHDAYNTLHVNASGGTFPMRYITRYLRGKAQVASVNEAIASGEVVLELHQQPPEAPKTGLGH